MELSLMPVVLELTATERANFWAQTTPVGNCLWWDGGVNKGGYGYITIRGKQRYAHHVAYLDVFGIINDGMDVCHTCDTPPCVEPLHLFQGTHLDNMRDMVTKGRQKGGPGLPEDVIARLRAEYFATPIGWRNLTKLAKDNNLSIYLVKKVLFGGTELNPSSVFTSHTIETIREAIIMARGIAISNGVKEEITNMREAGFSPSDISKELGVHIQTVYRTLGISGMDSTNVRKQLPSADDVVAMLGDYAADMSVGDIIRKYRTNVTTFYNILRDAGVETRIDKQKRQREEALEDAITMYVNGSPIHEIHNATGVPPYTMNLELHKRGIPLRRPR